MPDTLLEPAIATISLGILYAVIRHLSLTDIALRIEDVRQLRTKPLPLPIMKATSLLTTTRWSAENGLMPRSELRWIHKDPAVKGQHE